MYTDFSHLTVSFYGLGLIGGSIAIKLRSLFPDMVIKAYDVDSSSLSIAKGQGTISECYYAVEGAFYDCDILFLCAPVSENDKALALISEKQAANDAEKDSDQKKNIGIITDVGSVKNTTMETVKQCGLSSCFIGGHPMAGSEKTGFANASGQLLENAFYLITPTDEVAEEKVSRFTQLIRQIGAIPLVMSSQEHDEITGGISHLPHVISAALVNFVKEHDKDGLMKTVAAGGFRDITRISSSSPEMWRAICMANTQTIRRQLGDYISALQHMDEVLARRDEAEIYHFFENARDYRDSFQTTDHGPIKKAHDLFVDIPDVPGSIAQTATILALHSLSIKNIGIMHSREFQEGALRIEFYDDDTAAKAAQLLTSHSYKIFRRT